MLDSRVAGSHRSARQGERQVCKRNDAGTDARMVLSKKRSSLIANLCRCLSYHIKNIDLMSININLESALGLCQTTIHDVPIRSWSV